MVKHYKDKSNGEMLASAYASRYMTEALPKYSMPEKSMPSNVARQLISDELNLDGKPAQNLASFVTTWMEPEVNELIKTSIKLNLADEDEYPHVIKMQDRCINIIARMVNADVKEKAVGAATIGSSEAVMLAGLAMKWKWRQYRQNKGLSTDKPNLIMGENVQVVWEKFCRYFDVEPNLIPLKKGQYVITPEQVVEHCNENTIGVCAILGTTFTGEFEPIKEINEALEQLEKDKGLDIPLHVDAASGGFVAPFLYPDLEWDFRLSRVVSMNISGHKYGLTYPGMGWVIWRDEAHLPEDLIFHVNYLGGDLPTFTLNFSRPAYPVVTQYYNFLRLGKEGYTNIMQNLKKVSDCIANKIDSYDCFTVVSSDKALPLVAWTVSEDVDFDAFQLSDKLREFGWIVPAYTMPPDAQDVTVLRIVVREHLSQELAGELLEDLDRAIIALKSDRSKVEGQLKYRKMHKVC